MPTYRNDTAAKITHQAKNNMEWMPGEEKRLAFFVPYERLGLTLVDPEPYVRRRSSVYDYNEFEIQPGASLVYVIPYHETFELSLSMIKGAVEMLIGDGDVPTVIDDKHDHVSTYAWDQTAYLTFKAIGTNTAQIKVKVEAKTWQDAKRRGGV